MHVSSAGPRSIGGYFTVPAEKPTVIEFEGLFGPRRQFPDWRLRSWGVLHPRPDRVPGARAGDRVGRGRRARSWTTWPPESHRRLFGDVDSKTATLADAEQVLRAFIPRAFRRPVRRRPESALRRSGRARLDQKSTFEEALRAGMRAVLCSPNFLFLDETPGKLDDFALAVPAVVLPVELDARRGTARPGQREEAARYPQELRRQVERMLKDPRAAAFTENFVGQWLDLRQIDATTPDKQALSRIRRPAQAARCSGRRELFFEEVLKNDLSLPNFVSTPISRCSTSRSPEHYGIRGVEGLGFRKVTLPPGSHRGGVLTQAAC